MRDFMSEELDVTIRQKTQGPKGDTGLQGDVGAKGKIGAKGKRGSKGNVGSKGKPGPKGMTLSGDILCFTGETLRFGRSTGLKGISARFPVFVITSDSFSIAYERWRGGTVTLKCEIESDGTLKVVEGGDDVRDNKTQNFGRLRQHTLKMS
ncbi:collagen-like protein [Streptomyces sp. FIT100]|uniref:collagen-like protein n=1 Tax=Streptomyces sp. FIT100 TaxID=2837956 RepID=UPI0021C8BD1B|nr:collagen-like protein [Streptomyces sp. FIT100]UUN30793.1 hypothetical protein KK483_34010 [Streptomyces sp. FIT100]